MYSPPFLFKIVFHESQKRKIDTNKMSEDDEKMCEENLRLQKMFEKDELSKLSPEFQQNVLLIVG